MRFVHSSISVALYCSYAPYGLNITACTERSRCCVCVAWWSIQLHRRKRRHTAWTLYETDMLVRSLWMIVAVSQ